MNFSHKITLNTFFFTVYTIFPTLHTTDLENCNSRPKFVIIKEVIFYTKYNLESCCLFQPNKSTTINILSPISQ
jgi:hypothetical protein